MEAAVLTGIGMILAWFLLVVYGRGYWFRHPMDRRSPEQRSWEDSQWARKDGLE